MKEIYDKLSKVPKNALKEIQAGRLKGKSDINPQWRIEAMTEQFGLCGIGWKYEITKQWTEQGSDNQLLCFTNVNLFVKVDNEWSEAIPGTGGNMLVTNEKNGLHTSDEGYKMSLTDALSVAMKFIGVAAEIYRGVYDSKYSKEPQQPAPPKEKPLLTENHEQWNRAVKHMADGGDISKIEAVYKLSKEIKEKLLNPHKL